MTKQPLSVTEMFSSIMELLEQAGYAKHTLWGNMYGSLKSVVSFYKEKGLNDYDPAVTLEFLQTVEKRYREGGIGREYYNAQKRAARKFEMFHTTGTLTWECTKKDFQVPAQRRIQPSAGGLPSHQGISTKIPNGILPGQCGAISHSFRKKGFLHWTELP